MEASLDDSCQGKRARVRKNKNQMRKGGATIDKHTSNHSDVPHNNEDPKYNNPLNGKSIIFWGAFVCMVKWAPRKDC